MVGNDIGKILYTTPEFIASTQLDEVEKIFRNSDDGLLYLRRKRGENLQNVPLAKFLSNKKTIAGLLTQIGLAAPQLIEYENDLEYSPVFQYNGVGSYEVSFPGILPDEKILIITQSLSVNKDPEIYDIFLLPGGANTVIIGSTSNSIAANGIIIDFSFKIEIYKV